MCETSSPISIVGPTYYMGMDKLSLIEDETKGEDDGNSQANTLAMLSSFIGRIQSKNGSYSNSQIATNHSENKGCG